MHVVSIRRVNLSLNNELSMERVLWCESSTVYIQCTCTASIMVLGLCIAIDGIRKVRQRLLYFLVCVSCVH